MKEQRVPRKFADWHVCAKCDKMAALWDLGWTQKWCDSCVQEFGGLMKAAQATKTIYEENHKITSLKKVVPIKKPDFEVKKTQSETKEDPPSPESACNANLGTEITGELSRSQPELFDAPEALRGAKSRHPSHRYDHLKERARKLAPAMRLSVEDAFKELIRVETVRRSN